MRYKQAFVQYGPQEAYNSAVVMRGKMVAPKQEM
jgi:hypothetical protein